MTKLNFCGVRRRDASTSCPGLRCSSTGPRSTQFSRCVISADLVMRIHVQKTVSRCFSILRQLRSIRHSVIATTFQTLIVWLVLSRLDYGNAVLAGLPVCSSVFSRWWTGQHGSSTACVTPTTTPTHSSSSIGSGLRRECGSRRPCSRTRPLMELRRHTWVNWFVSPICLVGVPSALLGPNRAAGAAREAVYRWRPGLPGRRTHYLEQPTGQGDISPVSVNLPSAYKNISVPGLIPWHYHWSSLKLFPTSSGSWNDFVTWTTLQMHDEWLIDADVKWAS